jgi:endonuclease/exonuclease/phosphatase (EEP) superfamily protein YafD
MDGDELPAADEHLFASLGITAQAQEHVEQSVIDQVPKCHTMHLRLGITALAIASRPSCPHGCCVLCRPWQQQVLDMQLQHLQQQMVSNALPEITAT